MKTIVVKYGIDLKSVSVPDSTTIGQLVADENIHAELGYGDNIKASVEGVEQSFDVVVSSGSIVVLETRCNTKA